MAYGSKKPGTAVAKHVGPKVNAGQSAALAKSTGANIATALKVNAPTALQADGRTFHVEQYRAAALLIKSYRQEVGKTGANDAWIDAMATAMAAVFEADAKQYGVPFGVAYFVQGTK